MAFLAAGHEIFVRKDLSPEYIAKHLDFVTINLYKDYF